MTEKELLYVEDAVAHETNLIKYINYSIENAFDDDIRHFFENELNCHTKIKADLLCLLKECSNE